MPPWSGTAGGERRLTEQGVHADLAVAGGPPGRRHRTTLQLRWQPDDPLAVSLLLVAEPAHPALPQGCWVVLRDFLRYGLETPTGDGDVRICPAGEEVALILRSGRPCEVRVAAAGLREFLDATERVVPAGEERSAEALDALIERLLRR